MERIIRHITEQLIKLLPEGHEYYRLDELRSWGFPLFITQRIRVELERNLAESMNLPQTDWANMQSPSIREVWEQFIEAIRQEARLPASFVHPVVETAVADVVDMLVQPRKNLPEVIFGADQELTYDEIVDRMDAIVVYRHFAALIPRYMEKKELEKLTKERCTGIIASVDEKLTKRYSPLNWAQMLDPLFSLLDQRIDTNLLRLFFEDKKMPRLARQFDQLNTSVDRARFIEVLSSPESLNMEGYEEEQSELFNSKSPQGPAEAPVKDAKQELPSGTNGTPETEPESPSKKQPEQARSTRDYRTDPVVDAFHKFRRGLKEAETEPDKNERNGEAPAHGGNEGYSGTRERNYLNDIFRTTEDESGTDENEADARGYDKNGPSGEVPEPDTITKEESDAALPAVENDGTVEENDLQAMYSSQGPDNDEAAGDDEVPMWKRFLSTEERARIEADEKGESLDDDVPEDGTRSGLATEADSAAGDTASLQELLKDNKHYFVAHIFGGSEQAYDQTVAEIVRQGNWKNASAYISEEVFQRNAIDMYSEAAVDFTDRLHAYFLEKNQS